ncbi:MAG: glycosyltransferase family 2 protein [Chlorobi bacterium]|nr:glycosyltransferase family 2 protein [Chlorobiota bacterium]
MPGISVVIITLNEERNIGRCLDSVRDIADEVIVVDSFSTDRTEEICKQKGGRFVQHEFEDYVKQHVFADSLATQDYILSLDADEALSEELIYSIKEIKKDFKAEAYTMNRMTNYCGQWIKHCGWYPDKKLRLYHKDAGEWSGVKIHESFKLKEGISTMHLAGDILHYSFYTISEHIYQANKFTDLTAQAAFEKGIRAGCIKIVFSPMAKFIRDYIFNLGFLDGYNGFLICRISANATFLKYVKLKMLINQNKL